MKRKLFNLANGLTLSRFAAAPFMLWLILELRTPAVDARGPWISLACFVLFLVTVLTDLFDGMVARAYKVVTDFGKIMDPVADSTLFMTVLFAFSACERFRLPIWIPIIVLWREVAMHVLRRYAALRGIVLAAKFSGKFKMVVQCVVLIGFFLLLAASDLAGGKLEECYLRMILLWSGILIAVVNLLSLVEYFREVPVLVREWRGEADVSE